MSQNVKFFFTSDLSKYQNLEVKDPLALYFVEDISKGFTGLYKGENLIASGNLASIEAAGLMSSTDKKNLDTLLERAITKLEPADASIVIADSNKIGVAISEQDGNILQKTEDGLFVPSLEKVNVPEYSIEKQGTPEEGYAVSYKLKKVINGEVSYVGDTINIIKDIMLQSAILKKVTEAGVPYEGAEIGDPYIEMAFNDASASHLYVPVKDLVDTYAAGDGIKIENNVVSIELGSDTNGLYMADGKLNLDMASAEAAGAMSATDKKAIDKLIALDIPTAYGKLYEISHKPIGTLVDLNGKEMRVMCPASTVWTEQQGGGDPNSYYIGFKAYAPSSDVVSFKESLAKTMTDQTMYYFENNDFAGIDANGRKYSIVWLPVAAKQSDGSWIYYGKNSTTEKCIGWDYCVEWYNADGICVASDLIRISLTNEEIHNAVMPTYMGNYVTKEDLEIVQETFSWESL